MGNENRDLLAETQKYSTMGQRQRLLIDVLDLKIDGYVDRFCDQVRQNYKDYNGAQRTRHTHWRLGKTELLVTYHELPDVPGSAVYRLRHQPYQPGSTGDQWVDVMSVGEFENVIRQANREKGYSPGDLKAQANADKHRQEKKPKGIILEGLTGSHAYGLNHNGYIDPESGQPIPASDIDTRGIFVVSTQRALSLGFNHEQFVQVKGEDTAYDELIRFMWLCSSKCNPERLEMLASKKTIMTPEGQLIVDNRDMFLSKRIVNVYGGYAQGQLKLIERKVERKTKPAMHLIRLLLTGIRVLREGVIDPDMTAYRDRLLAIRTGEMGIEDVFKWHRELEVEFAQAAEGSKLPEQPDWDRINKVIMEIRLNHLVTKVPDGIAEDYRERLRDLVGFTGFEVYATGPNLMEASDVDPS